MTKAALIAALLLFGVVSAYGQSGDRPARPQRVGPSDAASTAVPPDPAALQKWFGNAVDDILTNADRTLSPVDATPHAPR